MATNDERGERTVKVSAAHPPPEPTVTRSIRLYEADLEELRRNYPDIGISKPIRRAVRRLADTLRKRAGEKPLGQPSETP